MNCKMDRRPAKVLVVEDHPDLLQFLELVLTRRGWDVITSSSGREALDKLKYTSPRLILLDMWMPGMDGFELARFLKRCPHYRDIPILAVTGLSSFTGPASCACMIFLSLALGWIGIWAGDRVSALLKDDDPVMTTVHFREDLLLPADRALTRFLRYVRSFPRANPARDFLG